MWNFLPRAVLENDGESYRHPGECMANIKLADLQDILRGYLTELESACTEYDRALNVAPLPDVNRARCAEAEINRLRARVTGTLRELVVYEPDNSKAVTALKQIEHLGDHLVLEDAHTVVRLVTIVMAHPNPPHQQPATTPFQRGAKAGHRQVERGVEVSKKLLRDLEQARIGLRHSWNQAAARMGVDIKTVRKARSGIGFVDQTTLDAVRRYIEVFQSKSENR